MMIRFEEEDRCFNYRIAGVVICDESVLLHRAEDDDFWTFPGGRPEFGETAEQTLKREMLEELGTEVEVVRPLWFVESFFTYADRRYHEIALYFLMRFPAASKYLIQPGPYPCQEKGSKLIFQWFSRQPNDLSGLPLLPSFLSDALQHLPDSLQHIIHVDEPVA